MSDLNFNPCEYLMEYITQEDTKEQRELFERHLTHCASCQEEVMQLSPIWNALPYRMEWVKPPTELKKTILQSVFNNQSEVAKPKDKGPIDNRLMGKRRFLWVSFTAAALFIGILLGSSWNIFPPKPVPIVAEDPLAHPTNVIHEVSLRSFDQTMPAAKGEAWLTSQGAVTRLVIQIHNLSSTAGEEAYQVWLVRDGKRSNAGTFRVDAQGNGILTYSQKDNPLEFDNIGITLEPDVHGDKPRGKKVLGT